MSSKYFRATSLVFIASLFLIMSGCKGDSGETRDTSRALIDVPAVGDIYAAELTQFSTASFEDQKAVYGLMKVVAIEPDKVTVVTENAASDNKAVPRQEILGDLSNVAFDDSERIDIVHSQLVSAYESGKIFAVRR